VQYTVLGKTGLRVSKVAFGALPIQRISTEEAVRILRKAYENGINFFDTARAYTDSEEKVGKALSDVRKNIVIATKYSNGLRYFSYPSANSASTPAILPSKSPVFSYFPTSIFGD
jgi:aryl-alcohol dehydrogenase-like predicted oxidoreductase